MHVQVVLPIPMESKEVWDMFKPFIVRFCDSWRIWPPGIRCQLCAVTQGADANKEVRDLFYGMPVEFFRHDEGMDLGAQQWIAEGSDNAFQVNMTSRCYFHRTGWLARMLRFRMANGPGLYGASCSKEGGKLHVCTRAHAYDVDEFKLYPHDIVSRDQGVFFEVADGSITDWYWSIGKTPLIVTWADNSPYIVCSPEIHPSQTISSECFGNGFRHGDQSDVLVWDRHTDLYAAADDREKERLRHLMMGTTP